MTYLAKFRPILLLTMCLLAAVAFVAHLRMHPPLSGGDIYPDGWAAAILTFVDMTLVTWLFARKRTAAWGYLLNGMIVIYGTVFMTHFGWTKVHHQGAALSDYIFHPTSLDVTMAWIDFFLGTILYRSWFLPASQQTSGTGTTQQTG